MQTCVDTVESSSKNNVVEHFVVGFLWQRPHFLLLARRVWLDPVKELVVVRDIVAANALANEVIGPIDMTLLPGEDDPIISPW